MSQYEGLLGAIDKQLREGVRGEGLLELVNPQSLFASLLYRKPPDISENL